MHRKIQEGICCLPFFFFLKCDFFCISITTSHSKSERLVLSTTVCTLGNKIVHKAKVNNFGAKGHGLQPPPTNDALDPPLFNVNPIVTVTLPGYGEVICC